MVVIRTENAGDVSAIRAVNLEAFGRPAEADLVDLLRRRGKLLLSLVAVERGAVVGHAAFSRVRLRDVRSHALGAGLGPMAVRPDRQRAGAGSLLVERGLELCRVQGVAYVVVLGHPAYYRRFGFEPASRRALRCAYDAPLDAFMVLELAEGCLQGLWGTILYEPEFDGV